MKRFRIFNIVGTSMLPAILPGSDLTVCHFTGSRLVVLVGDVFCYLGERDLLITHRVVGVEKCGSKTLCLIKGDFQKQGAIEKVPEDALCFRVMRVEHRLLSYDTDSFFGQVIAKIAVDNSRLWRRVGMGLVSLKKMENSIRGVIPHLGTLC